MKRNMSIHELQARRQQRITAWAMVAFLALSVPFLAGCGGDPDAGPKCGDGSTCERVPMTREEQQ